MDTVTEKELAHILLEYESYEVVVDEISRTLDLLRNLKENEEYFKLRVGAVAAFLPRNQPLYAFSCFVVVPSFMANEVHFRIPHSMRHFFPKLLATLEVYDLCPNIKVSHLQRTEFLKERSALRVNPKTKESVPVTDAVIFTGMPIHADQLRVVFDRRTLFISNGAGHNPIVVSKDADLDKAVEAALTLQLYNQGQDCAAPNSILVQKDVFPLFLNALREGLRTVGVGDYRDRKCRVGPISDPKDLVRIQDFLIDNREWLDRTTAGVIRAHNATLEPTIICKPLKEGGNFEEIFAPIMFVQEYEKDSDLALYFENREYAPHAMYISVYGTSPYVSSLADKEIGGKVLHNKDSILYNTHLHVHGIERGTKPYGGNGYGASNFSINGKITAKATLPQRDIYEQVVLPLGDSKSIEEYQEKLANFTSIVEKDVLKLLKLTRSSNHQTETETPVLGLTYVDMDSLAPEGKRFVQLAEEATYQLLESPNVDYISQLEHHKITRIRALKELLSSEISNDISLDDFSTQIYQIAVDPSIPTDEKRAVQLEFFKEVYELLFGKKTGPRLAPFFLEADRKKLCELLDV